MQKKTKKKQAKLEFSFLFKEHKALHSLIFSYVRFHYFQVFFILIQSNFNLYDVENRLLLLR